MLHHNLVGACLATVLALGLPLSVSPHVFSKTGEVNDFAANSLAKNGLAFNGVMINGVMINGTPTSDVILEGEFTQAVRVEGGQLVVEVGQ